MTIFSAQSKIADPSVTVRPLNLADSGLERDFIKNLSEETKRYRFLCAVKELPNPELKQLCTVDGNRSMAFVATVTVGGRETEIGVCRYAESARDNVREMAITIADSWKHRGLAQLLLKRLIDYAKSHGITQLYSVNRVDDEAMAEIATEFGMTKNPDPDDASQVVYSMKM